MEDPATNVGLRGNGVDAWYGWPTSATLESLREKWFDAADKLSVAEQISDGGVAGSAIRPVGAVVLANRGSEQHRRFDSLAVPDLLECPAKLIISFGVGPVAQSIGRRLPRSLVWRPPRWLDPSVAKVFPHSSWQRDRVRSDRNSATMSSSKEVMNANSARPGRRA